MNKSVDLIDVAEFTSAMVNLHGEAGALPSSRGFGVAYLLDDVLRRLKASLSIPLPRLKDGVIFANTDNPQMESTAKLITVHADWTNGWCRRNSTLQRLH